MANFYRQLRRAPLEIAAVNEWSREPRYYYSVRSQFPGLEGVERAKAFYYLNRLCFNGVWRTNRSGAFNVPIGRSTGDFPTKAELVAAADKLRSASILAIDYEECCAMAVAGDQVYLDPPYWAGRSHYGEYGYASFEADDEKRLVETCEELTNRGVHVILHYNRQLLLGERFSGWVATEIEVKRTVGGGHRRRGSVEVIVDNSGLL